jgi:Ser/Thr protein kinase RdoA (MazF antagonist)
VPTRDAELYACREGTLFTLSEPAGDRQLSVVDLGDHDSARRVGAYLARLHGALNSHPVADLPPRSSLWQDSDHDERIAGAREALLELEASPQRRTMFDALAVLDRTPAAREPLATVAEHEGVVHGDFWPGNVIVGEPPLSNLAVIDLESACRAPLLLDVAHFADLGFRSLAGWRKTREMDVALATTFARAYATASSMRLEELRVLPDLVVAARGCSILWIVERHLSFGPSALDQLVQNDLYSLQFVPRIADLWSDALSAEPRPTITVGS